MLDNRGRNEMKKSEIEHIASVVKIANEKLNKKFIFCMFLGCLVYAFCFIFENQALLVSNWTAQYIPSIRKILDQNTSTNHLAAKYFGVMVIFLLPLTLLFLWRENIYFRVINGLAESGKSLAGTLLFVYLLSLPFFLALIFVLYAAPFDMFDKPRLSGQHVVYLMINTYAGLLVFGVLLTASLPLIFAMVIGCIALPFSALRYQFSQRNKK
jgi:hypothetical protein